MAALTSDIQRSVVAGKPQRLVPLPVAAGETIYNGALVCVFAASGLAAPGIDAAGLIFMGIAYRGFDNALGSNGDALTKQRVAEIDVATVASYDVSGSAPKAGQRAFLVDDNTVSADPTTHNVDVGIFTGSASPNGAGS
jgi:hypothetical protein